MEYPRIAKLTEIGETPFRIFGEPERILQGWDPTIGKNGKTIYLFKSDNDLWAYYDKELGLVKEVMKWTDDGKAWIKDHWVRLGIYHRVLVEFKEEVKYNGWKDGKVAVEKTDKAYITITDAAKIKWENSMAGRSGKEWYKFVFTTRKKKTGGTMTYVDDIIYDS